MHRAVCAALVGELNEKIEGVDITQERLIGKINGENVYEKTVVKTGITLKASSALVKITYAHGVSNIKSLISLVATGGKFVFPYIDQNSGELRTFVQFIDDTNIIVCNKAAWSSYTFRFVIRYTKYE